MEAGNREERTVLFLHGNPTWSFLYRRFFEPIRSAGYHVLAPDLLGFGLSEKPSDWHAHSIDRHIDAIVTVLEKTGTSEPVLVCHDWGGPIGLGAMLRFNGSPGGLVFLNTDIFLDLNLPFLFRMLRWPVVGEIALERFNLFTEVGLRVGTFNNQRITGSVLANYRRPFRGPASRAGILAFPRLIPDGRQHPGHETLKRIRRRVREMSVPVLIVRGEQDPVFGPGNPGDLEQVYPGAHSVSLPKAGHYMQEDRPSTLVRLLRWFLAHRLPDGTG